MTSECSDGSCGALAAIIPKCRPGIHTFPKLISLGSIVGSEMDAGTAWWEGARRGRRGYI